MKVNITRIDSNLPLPEYASPGACAFDLYSRETTVIEPNQIALLPSNLIIQVPAGYVLALAPRSSLARKKSLVMPNSIGIIDQDFSGEKDEVMIQVQNIGKDAVTVDRGERVAQGLLLQIGIAQWEETTATSKSRGGFGSTGGYQ
jgi:dUTP pyrophosphatase